MIKNMERFGSSESDEKNKLAFFWGIARGEISVNGITHIRTNAEADSSFDKISDDCVK